MKHKIRKWNEETKANDIVEVDLTRTTAIHVFCINECMAGARNYVRGCTDPHCPLFPFRTRKATRIAKGKLSANQTSDAGIKNHSEKSGTSDV